MTKRQGDWMQTFSGGQFWPVDPRAAEIEITDIAHALSMQCRYAGHVSRFYSVAEHSILLSEVVPPELALWALLHDASEAYLVDVPRPVKKSIPEYVKIEERLMREVARRFGLVWPMPPALHEYDNRILLDEKEELMKGEPAPWGIPGLRLGVKIMGWPPHAAKRRFRERFDELGGRCVMPLAPVPPPAPVPEMVEAA